MATDNLSPSAEQFIGSVLALQPRVAVFDCDGTLWQGDSGADFFYWQIGRSMVSDDLGRWAIARYDDYKAGNVDEETMCGEMVTINAGLRESLLEEAVSGKVVSVRHQPTPEEMRAFFEAMAAGSEKIPQLPDEAFQRESFYQDHD